MQYGGVFRILLVEDHEDTRETLLRLLRRRGHRVLAVSSVKETVNAAQQTEFDLAISDIGLPGGSGLELPKALSPGGSRPLALIALSGFCLEEDIRHSHRAGFALHLTKPVDMRALDQTIRVTMER